MMQGTKETGTVQRPRLSFTIRVPEEEIKAHVKTVAGAFADKPWTTATAALPSDSPLRARTPMQAAVAKAFLDDWRQSGGPGVWPDEQLLSFVHRWKDVMRLQWYAESAVGPGPGPGPEPERRVAHLLELRGMVNLCATLAARDAVAPPRAPAIVSLARAAAADGQARVASVGIAAASDVKTHDRKSSDVVASPVKVPAILRLAQDLRRIDAWRAANPDPPAGQSKEADAAYVAGFAKMWRSVMNADSPAQ
jgi:hypothetical protein